MKAPKRRRPKTQSEYSSDNMSHKLLGWIGVPAAVVAATALVVKLSAWVSLAPRLDAAEAQITRLVDGQTTLSHRMDMIGSDLMAVRKDIGESETWREKAHQALMAETAAIKGSIENIRDMSLRNAQEIVTAREKAVTAQVATDDFRKAMMEMQLKLQPSNGKQP